MAPSTPSLLLLTVEEEVVLTPPGVEFNLDAPNFEVRTEDGAEAEERRDEEVTIRGDTGTGAMSAGFGDGVLPMIGGAGFGDDLPEDAAEGLGVDGLLQEVKKSSSSGLAVNSVGSMLSSLIPFGKLSRSRSGQNYIPLGKEAWLKTDLIASSLMRFWSSSRYSPATRLEYFFFTSESLRSEEPP